MRLPALSNHVRVPSPDDVHVPSPESNGRGNAEAVEEGVLSNLPRTRPQRTTNRRIASREGKRPAGRAAKGATGSAAKGTTGATANGAGGGATGSAASPKRATRAGSSRKTAKPRTQAAPRPGPRPPVESAPRQGFESEPSRTATGPVQPPGGAELVASAVEIVGEVARAGVTAGERVLKDLFSRLPH
jgi:hypothetical protein